MRYSVLSKYRSELMGAAMLWVMLFHAQDLGFGAKWVDWVRSIGFGGVDIFILVSAMGLVCSLSRREQEYSAFMSRRASRILPAYFVVMLPYTVFCIAQGNAMISTLFWNSTLLYYWVHAAGGFNWYIAGIMFFYALTPFCFRRMRKSRRREALTLLGAVLGLLICRMLIMDGYWNHLDIFYRIPVFCIGLLMGFYVLEDRKLSRKDVLVWCACLAAGAAYVKAISRVDFYLPLCHLFVFTTVPMCLAGCFCFEKLPLGGLRKFLRLVGENSLEIYLLNVSFFAERELLQRRLEIGPGHYVYYLITFSLNILLGVLLHRGIEAVRMHFAAGRRNRQPYTEK